MATHIKRTDLCDMLFKQAMWRIHLIETKQDNVFAVKREELGDLIADSCTYEMYLQPAYERKAKNPFDRLHRKSKS